MLITGVSSFNRGTVGLWRSKGCKKTLKVGGLKNILPLGQSRTTLFLSVHQDSLPRKIIQIMTYDSYRIWKWNSHKYAYSRQSVYQRG